jgi:hypothetical protein
MMIITFSDIINDGMMIDRTRVFLRLAAKKALYIYIDFLPPRLLGTGIRRSRRYLFALFGEELSKLVLLSSILREISEFSVKESFVNSNSVVGQNCDIDT